MKFIKFRKSWNLKEGDQIGEICQERLIIKRVNGKIGIWDYEGKNIIPDQKQKIKSITVEEDKKVFIIKNPDSKIHFYDFNGKEFECGAIDKYEIYRKTCIVEKEGKEGVISIQTGKTIIPTEFDRIEKMSEHENTIKYGEIFKVFRNGKCGCYFENEGPKLPIEFDDWYIRNGEETFNVINNNLHGVYDFNGKEIIPIKYSSEIESKLKQLDNVNNCIRIYTVKSENGKGLYSETGKQLIPAEYDEIQLYEYLPNLPFVVVKKGKEYEILNLEGKSILTRKYHEIGTFEIIGENNSNAPTQFLFIKQNSLLGFFSIYSQKFVEPEFDKIKWDPEYGLIVSKGELEGLYSIQGECILKVQYDNIVKENIFSITDSKWRTYLKIKGTNGLYGFYYKGQLYEPQFKGVSMLRDCVTGLYVVKDGLCGIYSSSGKMIIMPECSEIKKLSIKDNYKTFEIYVFKKENMYGFYFYGKCQKVIEAQFTKFEATINQKLQIIAEREDGNTVIIDENGTVNNSQTEVV